MSEHTVMPQTADLSVLVQQLLLAQGGKYASSVDELTYMHSPLLVRLGAKGGEEYGRSLPSGLYLVVPWDLQTVDRVETFISRVMASENRPDSVVLVSSRGGLARHELDSLMGRCGVNVVAVDHFSQSAFGERHLAHALASLFEDGAAAALRWVNPLSQMTVLADPRDPYVFFERLRRANPKATATRLLIGANVLVYFAMKLSGGGNYFDGFSGEKLIDWGANISAFTISQGETWRLLTCTFLHADLMHIGFNMYALKVLGDTAERLFGTPMFVALYLLSALGGSVASLGFTLSADPQLPSVGASGAVFGIMGGLLGFALSRRGTVPPEVFKGLTRSALMFIAINVAIGFTVAFIDNAAHLGGLAAGIVGGYFLSRDLPPSPQPSPRLRGTVIVAMLVGLTVGYFLAAHGIEAAALRAYR